MSRLLVLLCAVGAALADTPANCTYEDIRGSWTIQETERSGDNTLNCDRLGPIVHKKTFTLSFPNSATDELGNQGTWTMIYNQGFEVNINQRSYFAFSYFEGNSTSSISYCDRTFNGWSRDKTIRNWSCYFANKTTPVPPHESHEQETALPSRLYRNDHKMIEEINRSQHSWRARAYPQHERYTVEEMILRGCGLATSTPQPPPPAPTNPAQKTRASFLPKNFDWRNVEGVNYVSPVRNQAGCGSCYAFASMGILEARITVATGGQRRDVFSPQDVVSCSVLSQGCAGGFSYLIAGRYAQDQGVVAEECNTYTGEDDACTTNSTCARTYVSDYKYVGGYYGACNEAEMMLALVEGGPIAVGFMVYDDFANYKGGIYHHTGSRNSFNPFELMNHAVLMVGYGEDEASGEKFWTVKNSWGAEWGEDGYFRIRRGTDECGIESAAVEVTVIP